jgi:phospholipase C
MAGVKVKQLLSFLASGTMLLLVGCARGLVSGGSAGDIAAVNHVVFMLQENRSFDTYFGQLNTYRQAQGLSPDVDGMPASASNPADDGSIVSSYKLNTLCIENLSPAWLESHGDYNRYNPTGPPLMDGFVHTAQGIANYEGLKDTAGKRAMGYYDANDLPYYYFMATAFATSDRWFAPMPTNSPPNRIAAFAATTQGHAHEPLQELTAPTIFHRLADAGISWRIYYTSTLSGGAPADSLHNYWPTFANAHSANIVPVSQYLTDAKNGTLPAVSFIEAGYFNGLDEHPSTGTNISAGQQYVASLVNALMTSASWKDSVFILSYDESGGTYDHVVPINAVQPDGIPPSDLTSTDPPGDFTRTGFRLPLIVMSPFTRKGYVSHKPADYTAVLKFIETRWRLSPLTKRDAAQMDMTEFFNFSNPPWATPPNPPTANMDDSRCYDGLP